MNSFAEKADARFLKVADAGDLATKDKVALADLDTDATAKVTALDTLIGSDTGKSTRTIANEELAARLIPEDAREALDTLEEIAAYIQDHPEEVGAINRKLTLGTHEVEGEQKQYDTVKAYVEAYVAAQIGGAALQGSDSISIVDGVISAIVNAVNGLSVDSTNGISLAAVTASVNGVGGSNGAMLATDKEKLDSLVEATDQEVAAVIAAIWAD